MLLANTDICYEMSLALNRTENPGTPETVNRNSMYGDTSFEFN